MAAEPGTDEFASLLSQYGADLDGEGPAATGNLYGIPAYLADAPIIWDYGKPGQTDFFETEKRGWQPDVLVPSTPGVSSSFVEAMDRLYGFDDEELPKLQQLLLAGGFYDRSYYAGKRPDAVQFGIADDDTENAWRRALERAAKSKKSIWDVLGDAAKTGGPYGQEGEQVETPTFTRSNPDDLRAVAQAVGRKLLGREPGPDEFDVDAFIREYQQSEVGFQRAAYEGGTVTRPASPEVAAERDIRAAAPTEALAHDYAAGTMESFLSLIGGGS